MSCWAQERISHEGSQGSLHPLPAQAMMLTVAQAWSPRTREPSRVQPSYQAVRLTPGAMPCGQEHPTPQATCSDP